MTDFVRRIVSGNKARFKDDRLGLELDLAYITDRVMVMGYPASGLEGLYRNKREDAKKFLDTRHGKNYWVFNFCPVHENSYPSSVFEGRVSRYPFPDHHAPPLALLPLVAREIRLWLDGPAGRIVALHCKAGKGRSGTMACSYLMSLEDLPSPPNRERNYTAEEWVKVRADEAMQAIPPDDPGGNTLSLVEDDTSSEGETAGGITGLQKIQSPQPTPLTPPESDSNKTKIKSASDTLRHVLELHTSRRMKGSSTQSQKVKQGVSIPSQRRWLYYWSLLLSNEGPPKFWTSEPHPKIRITSVTVRMKDLSPIKSHLVKAANAFLDRTNAANSDHGGRVWVSLARYDDQLVDRLERWEQTTRSEGHIGKRKAGSDHMDGQSLSDLFTTGQWDQNKMVRCFARLGTTSDDAVVASKDETHGKVSTYILRPLSGEKWSKLQKIIKTEGNAIDAVEIESETTSINDVVTQTLQTEVGGVVLDANREVRIKLYIGQVFMGWFWFIPAFHMLPDERVRHLKLSRKEIDFPIGIGSALIDVEVSMERCEDSSAEPPSRMESKEGKGEPTGDISSALMTGNITEAVEIKQATED